MSGQSNLLCVDSTPINVGIRVVRGPDWKWANQDDGEGHVGTVVEIGQTGSHITPEKTVIVQWDSGNRSNYRVGFQDAYDLRILDNAQIGIIHYGITCSYCDTRSSTTTNTCINGGTSYITGIRWKCSVCTDVNLCSKCYHSDRHNLSHYFLRIDAPGLAEVSVPSRATSNLKLSIKGIFTNSKVIRGYDWEWDNQDGGDGKVGRVLDIRGWTTDSFRSVANVIWPSGVSNVYRLGHRGKVDLKYVAQSDGGKYYRDHLPILSIPSDFIHLDDTPYSSHSVSKAETTIATSTHSHGPSNNNNGFISNSNSNGFASVPSTVVNNTADIVTSNDSTDDATITATSTSSKTTALSTAPHHHPDWSSVATSGISGSQVTASSSTTLAASTANAGSNGATSASPIAASSASSAVGTSTVTSSSSSSSSSSPHSSNAPCTKIVSAVPSEATSIVPASTSSSKKTAGYATNSLSSTPALPFKVGDKVKVIKNRHELRVMQTGHGGWNPKMGKYCFQIGVVHRITVGGDVRVKFGLGEKCPKYTFHPESLAFVYFVGDAVKVIDDLNQVKALQDGHGEWVDQMKTILGAKGKVIEVYPDGDLRVSFENDKVWTMNPATVTLVQSNMTALESVLAAAAAAASSSNSPVATVTSAVTSSNEVDDGTLVTSDNTNMLNSLSPRFAQISLDEPHLGHHNSHGGPSNGRSAHRVTGNRQTLSDISDVLSMDATMTSSPSSTSVPVAIPGVKHLSRSSHHSSDGGHVLLRKDKNNHTHVSPNNAIGSPSGSGVTSGQTSDNTIERMRYLENKIAEMEEVYCCGICLERVRNVVFLCGHGACVNCAQSLRICHMCRQVITRKINIY